MDQPLNGVLVTGGSGYVGSALLDHLRGAGLTAINLDVAARGPNSVVADIRRLPPDLPAADVVVHAAALAGGGRPSGSQLHDVNVDGTRAVVRHALDTGVRRLILLSSIAVLGPSELPMDESASMRPDTTYGRSKCEAEEVTTAMATGTPLEVVIVRPGYVFGADHPANFGRMIAAISRGMLVLPGRVDTIKAGIYRPDLVSLVHRLAVMPDPPALVHAVYPDTPTVLAWTRQLQSLIAPDHRVHVAPDVVASLVLRGLGVLADLSGQPRLADLRSTAIKLRESSNVISRIVGGPDWPFDFTWRSAARDLVGAA